MVGTTVPWKVHGAMVPWSTTDPWYVYL